MPVLEKSGAVENKFSLADSDRLLAIMRLPPIPYGGESAILAGEDDVIEMRVVSDPRKKFEARTEHSLLFDVGWTFLDNATIRSGYVAYSPARVRVLDLEGYPYVGIAQSSVTGSHLRVGLSGRVSF
jgi:hypothetical protein